MVNSILDSQGGVYSNLPPKKRLDLANVKLILSPGIQPHTNLEVEPPQNVSLEDLSRGVSVKIFMSALGGANNQNFSQYAGERVQFRQKLLDLVKSKYLIGDEVNLDRTGMLRNLGRGKQLDEGSLNFIGSVLTMVQTLADDDQNKLREQRGLRDQIVTDTGGVWNSETNSIDIKGKPRVAFEDEIDYTGPTLDQFENYLDASLGHVLAGTTPDRDVLVATEDGAVIRQTVQVRDETPSVVHEFHELPSKTKEMQESTRSSTPQSAPSKDQKIAAKKVVEERKKAIKEQVELYFQQLEQRKNYAEFMEKLKETNTLFLILS